MKSDCYRPLPCISVAILAGGAATRLGGVDKGLMPLNARPLIAWVVESLAQNADWPRLIIANRNIAEYSRFAPTISDRQKDEFAGPLAGVAAALLACETEWLYTVPVDSANANPALAMHLLQHALERGADSVVAHDGRRRQPLFALYRRALAESADNALSSGFGVSRWQDTIRTLEIASTGLGDVWINLNTVDDFTAMCRRMRGHD
ncbi:MAG: NTP transferase domain-containing protein [Dokdonella sp.]